MANEESRLPAGKPAEAGKPGPGAEQRCALCPLGGEAVDVLGPLLWFTPADAKKPGGWLVHSMCAKWAPKAHHSEQPGSQHSLLMVPEECRRARLLRCKVCGKAGAAMGCNVASCSATYHLPCAMRLEGTAFDCAAWAVYCPLHRDRTSSEQETQDMFTRRRQLRRLHQRLPAAGEAAARPADGVATPARAPLLSNGSASPPSATSSKPSGAASGLPPAKKRRLKAAGEAPAGGAAVLSAPHIDDPELERMAQEQHGKRPQAGALQAAGQEPPLPPAKLPRHGPSSARSLAGVAEVSADGCAAQAVSAGATPAASLERASDELRPAAPAREPPSLEPTRGPAAALLPASRHRSEELSAAAAAAAQQPGEQQEQQEQGGQEGMGDQLPLDVRRFIVEVFEAAAPAAIPAAKAYLWQEGVRSFADLRFCDPQDFFEHVPCTRLLLNKFFLLQAERNSAAEGQQGAPPQPGVPSGAAVV